MSFSLQYHADNNGLHFDVIMADHIIAEWVEHNESTFSMSAFNTPEDMWVMTASGIFAPEHSGLLEMRVDKRDLLDATESALGALTCGGSYAELIETPYGFEVQVEGKPVIEYHANAANIDGFEMWSCSLSGAAGTVVVPVESLPIRQQAKWFNPYPFVVDGDYLHGSAKFHLHELLHATPLLVASASIFKTGSRF